ncbi:monocarboxylate transporter 7-like [Pecten maximus]|uniref:monocarboxylate transporter 7-like n=1 Tax=Pecten maximus TaxID=6579 RepID=UPI001458240A|nr:monocarboxylate transporter 7-like [Pecten maximus]
MFLPGSGHGAGCFARGRAWGACFAGVPGSGGCFAGVRAWGGCFAGVRAGVAVLHGVRAWLAVLPGSRDWVAVLPGSGHGVAVLPGSGPGVAVFAGDTSVMKQGERERKEEAEEEEEDEEVDKYKQTDRGWAWMVLIALVILPICEILDANRPFVIIGGILAFASYLLSSFVRTPELLVLTIGFLFGSAMAFTHGPALVMLGKYFDKRRGMANAVMNFGGSFGRLVLPNLFRILLDVYALQGTLLIASALLFHIMVTGSLLRPLRRRPIINKLLKDNGEGKIAKKLEFNGVIYKPLKVTTASIGQSYDRLVMNHGQDETWSKRSYKMLQAERRRTVSDSVVTGDVYAAKSRFHKSSELAQGLGDALGSLGHIHFSVSSAGDENDSEDEEDTCVSSFCHKLTCKNVLASISDLKLLKNKLFLMNLTSSVCSVFGLALIVTYLPHHAKDVGMSDQQTTQLLTIIGCTDLLNKFILAFIADNKRIKRHFLVAGSLIITAISTLLIPYCTEFWSLALYSVLYGTFHGTFFAMLAVLVVDFVGIENISNGLAITMLSHGVSVCVFNPIIGAIRDNFHSYTLAFYLMGGFMLFGGIILFLEPKIRQYEERKNKDVIQTELQRTEIAL